MEGGKRGRGRGKRGGYNNYGRIIITIMDVGMIMIMDDIEVVQEVEARRDQDDKPRILRIFLRDIVIIGIERRHNTHSKMGFIMVIQ